MQRFVKWIRAGCESLAGEAEKNRPQAAPGNPGLPGPRNSRQPPEPDVASDPHPSTEILRGDGPSCRFAGVLADSTVDNRQPDSPPRAVSSPDRQSRTDGLYFSMWQIDPGQIRDGEKL
ncbi:MAG: hypothetical protein Kow001_10370 [Acidobacteriota bacterium]